MQVSFPAIRGQIGQRTYYSCLMPLSVIPKMFTFRDWADARPEDREQRLLNQKRVPVIAKYILDNEDGYLFSSITASYQCDVKFAAHDSSDIGILEMQLEDANFVINDGQHRCAAIAHALSENPALGEETLSVLLFEYQSRERVQQMFSDLNRFVAKTSKSLDILYDKRDLISRATLSIIEMVPVFKDMVDKNAVSIGLRSAKLFSLAALYDANKELLRFQSDRDEANVNELVRVASEFWEAVSKAIPDWQRVKNQQLPALELRQEKISSHAVVLRALGAAGGELMKECPNDWKSRLHNLTDIDWSKGNLEWEGICIIANSVVSNRQARTATKAYIKRHLGLALTDAEARMLSGPSEQIAGSERDDVREKGFTALAKRVLAFPSVNRHIWHDILEALVEYSTYRAPRMRIIDRVEEIRKERGEPIPTNFEQTVQRCFQDYCAEAANFHMGSELNLFCFPEGKGSGIWGLNVEVVERLLLKLERQGLR